MLTLKNLSLTAADAQGRADIVKKSTWLDLPMRYHPYSEKKLHLIQKFMK